ncbi:MAG TPA: 23S rRNA (adenine(2503)-C(2))-methyltransferase RlmN [Phycisphaerae bacterium]|nr:23S rRNA (adenine(2503)-C(2))-methyltransferase RlmN [Phycisphaerae bacterium]HOJ72907.1 23S rRNA (adenine(2503)-C(2))-methyltransferase RlmN [Phycisphaerae bacterium]HOM50091.1 23S rRNA (adenine(2503)-C(2))-methyltransferase RlmN [Phycisphaerae bacterium]HON65381.1 23S rRNA (adenine(2503)-C(2))-methyltransferase RlmN [Phycisphaerae bacterium]HOQ86980.1 23S rRNA (adenine(2503)-C(2))-methyltransferase RlmN [Phycisphaerae bacterium]
MTNHHDTQPGTPAESRRHLLGTSLEAFTAFCAEHDLPAYRAKQVYEWVFRRGADSFEVMTNLSKPLRAMLAEHWVIYTSQVVQRQESTDGTIKLLLQWPDRATSECVLIPDDKRRTACISSQVGCPVGCAFCASGIGGLQRQLSPGEIVEQAMRVRSLFNEANDSSEPRTSARAESLRSASRVHGSAKPDDGLSNIVFMGLGEPLANYGATLAAVRIINADWGMNIGARKITISTVGLPTQIRKLAREGLQVNLAISLHAPNDGLRKKLIPWAKKTSVADLVAAGREFFDVTGREVTLEYILLAGVNDTMEHAHELTRVCRRMRCNVNLIRYNPVADLGFERPDSYAAHRFAEELRSRGVNVHIRKSRGADIDAACGQLRRKNAITTPTRANG